MANILPGGADQAEAESEFDTMRQAVAAFHRGDHGEAELLCKLVLARNDRQFAALHILGMIALLCGRPDEAQSLIAQALRADPQAADAHCNLARAMSELGRSNDALASCDRALAIDPNHVFALNNRGSELWKLKRPAEALETLDRALAIQPDYVDALCNRGNALVALGRLEDAVKSYDRALAIEPNDSVLLTNRGNALWALKRSDEALASYDRALSTQGTDIAALKDRGNALLQLGRAADALTNFDRILLVEPGNAVIHNSRGKALYDLGNLDEALASYDRALELQPDYITALVNFGAVQSDLNRHDQALGSFHKALELQPEHADAHFAAGCVQLRLGNFGSGWQQYSWRTKAQGMAPWWLELGKPLWHGQEDIAGKTILLHSEQGFGDTIQFCRYVEMVVATGARIVLNVQPELKSLMRANLPGCEQVIARGDPLPEFDVHCALMNLPQVFQTTLETIPGRTPYLAAQPDLVAAWGEKLGPKTGLRVGLIWSGNPMQGSDRYRSMPLRYYRPLFTPGVQFVSLQKDVRDRDREFLQSRENLLHFGDDLKDFADTAALVANVDLVISVCTSGGHLAAAMNKPTWFVLSNAACWRWLLDREDSPWYPSARLFRQSILGDWTNVVARVAKELAEVINGRISLMSDR